MPKASRRKSNLQLEQARDLVSLASMEKDSDLNARLRLSEKYEVVQDATMAEFLDHALISLKPSKRTT